MVCGTVQINSNLAERRARTFKCPRVNTMNMITMVRPFRLWGLFMSGCSGVRLALVLASAAYQMCDVKQMNETVFLFH